MTNIASLDSMIGKWASMLITFFGFLLVLVITLYPYNFYYEKTSVSFGFHFLILGKGKFNTLDILQNVLLFLPLGFGLAGCMMHMTRAPGLIILATTVLVSLVISYAVEALQIFLPSRVHSLSDVLSNGAGGVLGFLGFLLWECKFRAGAYNSAFTKNNLHIFFLGYAAFAILISIPLQWGSSLSNWERSFHLILGNERTGDRPWQGSISEVYVADRAISETEAARILFEKEPSTLIGNSLLGYYKFNVIGSCHDQTGHLPALVWRGEPVDAGKGESVLLGQGHWLETKSPAAYLTQRIIDTSQFTLGATVATGDAMQTGPARIISLSKDHSSRNFTLGQEGNNLVFRLRTPLTGENGVSPPLIVPNIFSNTEPHNLIITYDGSALLLYIDGERNSHSLKLNPGTTLFSALFRLYPSMSMGYNALYYAFIFIPFGIMMVFTIKKIKMPFVVKIFLACGWILLFPFILEIILICVSGRDLRLENLLFSMMFMAGPMVLLFQKKN